MRRSRLFRALLSALALLLMLSVVAVASAQEAVEAAEAAPEMPQGVGTLVLLLGLVVVLGTGLVVYMRERGEPSDDR